MRSFITKTLLAFILSAFLILGLVYLGLGYYYRDSFSYGTQINGIYCTGHTPEEINRMLTDRYEYHGLTIKTENDDFNMHIDPQSIDFNYDFGQALGFFLNSQNSWLWPANLVSSSSRTLNPIVSFNTDKLDAVLDTEGIFTYDEEPEVSYSCENGVYVLKDNLMHRPETEKIRNAVSDCIYNSEELLVLDDSYFYDCTYTSEQMHIIEEYSDIKSMLGARVTYLMGEDREELDESVLSGFLLRDGDGNPVLSDSVEGRDIPNDNGQITDPAEDAAPAEPYLWDDEAIEAWVDDLADRYDTVGAVRKFMTTDSGEIEISGGIYGNKLNRKAEKEYLKNAVKIHLIEEHVPEYEQMALYQGSDDIGDTYIEVNMTAQNLYYYQNGELIIETPVVTGDMARRMSTPSGTNYIYFKQRNRTLIGPDYATFVNCWMAVNGHIGIHDATWRSSFGGDIYMKNGSHGCINTPMDAVSRLYELAEVGTPVIMYYTD